ncbi:MAG: trans-sulfuration enzyme family protein [Calditrichia bacterium]
MANNKQSLDTLLAQAGHQIDPTTGAINPAIHLSTTFARDKNYELIGNYIYGRYQNPTYDPVEQLMAQLEEGAEALVFASGMAALCAVFETLNSGDHVVAPQIMYHGGQDWLRRISEKRGIGLTLFDQRQEGALAGAIIQGKTKIVWIESPVNPTWDVIDIAASAKIAHEAGAALAVDCTVAPPVTTKALTLGADLVFHSATKYLAGHSDVLAGMLVTRELDERWEDIKQVRKFVGGVIGPVEAWLLLRGMRTLSLRFERASQNALKIARHFEHHSRIEKVLYPGLKNHPGHAIASKQMTGGFGGMLSMLVDDDEAASQKIATRLRCFIVATSLGGIESLVEHRASVEGPRSQVPKNLLRFSIGIEAPHDLIADLEQALEKS